MIIAIPISNDKLDLHFGHCKEFALLTVDPSEKKILFRENMKTPPHQPGLLPVWLAQLKVNMVIAGGIGQSAQNLLSNQQIKLLIGASQDSPENLVNAYLQGSLTLGENSCDH